MADGVDDEKEPSLGPVATGAVGIAMRRRCGGCCPTRRSTLLFLGVVLTTLGLMNLVCRLTTVPPSVVVGSVVLLLLVTTLGAKHLRRTSPSTATGVAHAQAVPTPAASGGCLPLCRTGAVWCFRTWLCPLLVYLLLMPPLWIACRISVYPGKQVHNASMSIACCNGKWCSRSKISCIHMSTCANKNSNGLQIPITAG